MTKNITDFVQSCIDDYKHFVDIDSFRGIYAWLA